jgi:hypothetical protein
VGSGFPVTGSSADLVSSKLASVVIGGVRAPIGVGTNGRPSSERPAYPSGGSVGGQVVKACAVDRCEVVGGIGLVLRLSLVSSHEPGLVAERQAVACISICLWALRSKV